MSRTVKTILIILVIALIGAGAYLILTSRGGDVGETIGRLFPQGDDPVPGDSGFTDTDTDPDVTGGGIDFPDVNTQGTSRLAQITPDPVAGYTILANGNIRYIEKKTGHVYEYDISTNSITKLSNKTMPGIQEVLWSGDGNSFIVRTPNENAGVLENTYLSFGEQESGLYFFAHTLSKGDRGEAVLFLQKTLNASFDTQVAGSGPGSPGSETTFFGPATEQAVTRFQEKYANELTSTEPGIVSEATLAKINSVNEEVFGVGDVVDIPLFEKEIPVVKDIVANKSGTKIFYLLSDNAGVSGIVANFNNTNQKELFSHSLSDWTASWNSPLIYLTTKASQGVRGFAFALDASSGVLTKTLEDIDALTTNEDSSGNFVLYSKKESRGNGFSTHLYERADDTHSAISLATLAEKCVWGDAEKSAVYCGVPNTTPRGVYPDDWYKGRVSFSDTLWKIDTALFSQDIVINPEQEFLGESFDTKNPQIDEERGLLYFVNKKDASLWSVSL